MKFRSLAVLLLAVGSLSVNSMLCADDAPAPKPGAGQKMRGGKFGMRNNRPMRDPAMMTARLVMKELRAYQADQSAENFAKLEKALNEAIKKDTAKRKEKLEKELAELDKTQAERAKTFLEKVKSGELKMPARPPRGKGGKGGKGPQNRQRRPQKEAQGE